MPTPPTCPNRGCNQQPLWKDTTYLHRGNDVWKWFCSACSQHYQPTIDELDTFRTYERE